MLVKPAVRNWGVFAVFLERPTEEQREPFGVIGEPWLRMPRVGRPAS